MHLRNKRILITAGPTWVPIDSVRVISNIATGKTGISLAKEAAKRGGKVTLFLGPVYDSCLDESIKVIRFKFFAELRNKIKRELRLKKYDYVIHSAAVSDFKPIRIFKGKIGSQKAISLKLKPLPKIFRDIRQVSPGSKLVVFKLETGVSDDTLIQRAKAAQHKAGAEFVVANLLKPYRAFIIDRKGKSVLASNKNELVKKLLKKI